MLRSCLISSSSNSKQIEDLGGIKQGNPLSPNAKFAGIVALARSPSESCLMAVSRPGTTCSDPIRNWNGLKIVHV